MTENKIVPLDMGSAVPRIASELQFLRKISLNDPDSWRCGIVDCLQDRLRNLFDQVHAKEVGK